VEIEPLSLVWHMTMQIEKRQSFGAFSSRKMASYTEILHKK